jgi:hypothetical protein
MTFDTEDTLRDLVALMPSPAVAERWQRYVKLHLKAFAEVLHGLPILPGSGSISTAEAFWLHRLVAELQPPLIIDSGSATGWSAHIMAAAASQAVIYSCDPYRRPESLPAAAIYHDRDWTRVKRSIPAGSFALFDDHVNQRRRVLQARRAGIAEVAFHDVYRVPTKSTISVAFADLIGLAERCHTFEPLWFEDPMFTDTRHNPQMYRWLTWLQLTEHPGLRPGPRVRWLAQRTLLRNPAADASSRLNWRARP